MTSSNLQKGTLVGGIVAAFVASLCCVGPVLFALLGIGSATALTFFADYRVIFIVIALGFWGVGAYFTYRKPRVDEECKEGEACAIPGAKQRNQIFLWIALGLILLFTLSPQILSCLGS